MAEFFAMGGYAFFVWGSYLVVAVTLIWSYLSPHRQHKTLMTQLQHSRQVEQHKLESES